MGADEAVRKNNIIIKSGVINRQAAYISRNSDDAYRQLNDNKLNKI